MARAKQAAVRRESSSEFFNRRTASWEEANGAGGGGRAVEAPRAAAGALQLAVAVTGIYASL